MSTMSLRFTAVDTLFFRDSRPFDAGPMQFEAESCFPPPARTLIGAVRLALARGQGFTGVGRWDEEIASVIGDGPDDLGCLHFSGPYVSVDGEPVYPMPLHVLGHKLRESVSNSSSFVPQTLLGPGPSERCDLGNARLPMRPQGSVRCSTAAGLFVRKAGLEAVLAWKPPAQETVVSLDALLGRENRVGLERDPRSRTAKQGFLYMSSHIRTREGVSMVLVASGIPARWLAASPRLIPLGGESRMAELESGPPLDPVKSPLEDIRKSGRLTVTLLTPLRLHQKTVPGPGEEIHGLPGAKVVSACLGKPVLLGGWDSLRREPLPLEPYLLAGSTWFCTMDAEAQDSILGLHGKCIGSDAPFGLGAIVLGTWDEISEF